MSNVSNRHSVVPFVAGESKPLHEQRLAKITYKSRGENEARFPSVCVSVPIMPASVIMEHMQQLMPYVQELIIAGAQDGIIKSLYESADGMLSSVSDEEISISACINFLQAASSGGRLTKESIGGWFDSVMEPVVAAILCEKLKIDVPDDGVLTTEQSAQIEPHIQGWRAVFCSLAAGPTVLQSKQITNLEFALGQCELDDKITAKLLARLAEMKKPKEITAEMLDLV